MQIISHLSVYQFKNYEAQSFSFTNEIVCIVGKNGVGKTTILDAIYFLCFTKSYFVAQDILCVKNGTQGMFVKGTINEQEVKCIIRENGKKEFSINEIVYTKLADHIGKFSCVIIAPDDVQLINEGSEQRRKFLDGIASQLNTTYLQNSIYYNKILLQRNAYLKSLEGVYPADFSLLNYYNEQLNSVAHSIADERKKIVIELNTICQEIYEFITLKNEKISIEYQSKLLDETLLNLLNNNLHKDVASGRSNYGIHKDDLLFYINGMPLKQIASQGQRKSFLFSLKLAQFIILQKKLHLNPILLLDDIFEKLDEERSHQLIQFIVKLNTQIFITDTHKERLEEALRAFKDKIQYIEIGA